MTRETRDAFRRYRELLARDSVAEVELPEWAEGEEQVAEELRRESEDGSAEHQLIEDGNRPT